MYPIKHPFVPKRIIKKPAEQNSLQPKQTR